MVPTELHEAPRHQSNIILVAEPMSRSLFSYVVRYDSGFAPNPFYGFCTLATCKPLIRKTANIGDWVVGTASAGAPVNRGGHLVYAMRVDETVTTEDYWNDPRFEDKKPNQYSSWKAASGDNIYFPSAGGNWGQLHSYHSTEDGAQRSDHTARDTGVPRILVSQNFVYFGGEGPKLPARFLEGGEMNLMRARRNYQREQDEEVISSFEDWLSSLDQSGFRGKPWDWVKRRNKNVFKK